MFDNVNIRIDRAVTKGKPFEVLPYLSDITEMQDRHGYCCCGNLKNYSVFIREYGVFLKGSLAKNYFGDNIHTLTRKDTQMAIEELSDHLHLDISAGKVTRLDISTVLYTKRPPSDYYPYLGQKPYFERLQSTPDTLYYNNHQRQIVFYDKAKEAVKKDVHIPEILQNSNLFRYELRYTKRLNKQLKTDVTAAKLYVRPFYDDVIKSWHTEFKSIHKLKNQSIMTDDITTRKEAKEALFTYLLQKEGQGIIDEFLSDLKAQKRLNNRSDYTKLKADLNRMITTSDFADKSDLIKELETQIFDIARYAR